MLRDYEMTLVLSPDVPEGGVTAAVEKITGFITARGGAVTQVNPWGRRKLAYPIKHFAEGQYVLTQLQLDSSHVRELESQLFLTEEVIRHLIVLRES